MCKSALRLLVILCLIVMTLCLPRKVGPAYYGQVAAQESYMRPVKEELPRDPWQDSMAELRVYSQPMPPLVRNDEAGNTETPMPPKPNRTPDFIVEVPPSNKSVEPYVFKLNRSQLKKLAKQGQIRKMSPEASQNSRRSFGNDDSETAAYEDGPIRFGQISGDHDQYDYDDENEEGYHHDDPNCPRDLYIDQMNMDFGETPKKYDWEQIGRHFVNYGRFTADMSDDLMRGLDNRFKQMKG